MRDVAVAAVAVSFPPVITAVGYFVHKVVEISFCGDEFVNT